MRTRLLALVLALWSTSALAHDARSSSVEVHVVGRLATVHLAATQAGLHASLEAAAGHTIDASSAGYQALVADHLRRTLRLSVDGQPLAVGDVGLRLGHHQSDARFVVDLPGGARELALTVDSFDGVEGQQTVVRVRQDEETTQAVLSAATGRSLSVPLGGAGVASKPETASPPTDSDRDARLSEAWGWWLGLVGLVAVLSGLAAVRRTERVPAVV